MAAPIAPDRKLAAEVRRMTLNKIKALFEIPRVDMTQHDADLHDQILVKLAGTVLPRLNEHTGEDGNAIPVSILSKPNVQPNNSDTKDSEDVQENQGGTRGDVSQ